LNPIDYFSVYIKEGIIDPDSMYYIEEPNYLEPVIHPEDLDKIFPSIYDAVYVARENIFYIYGKTQWLELPNLHYEDQFLSLDKFRRLCLNYNKDTLMAIEVNGEHVFLKEEDIKIVNCSRSEKNVNNRRYKDRHDILSIKSIKSS